jgi:hypothetical protein
MAASVQPSALPGLAVLEQTPIIVEKLVHAATEDQLRWKPTMDRWSISEVLAHLAEVEVVGFRERIEMMTQQKEPRLEAYDQNAAYAAGKYSGGKALDHLKQFCHERDRSLSFLRYLPAGALSRTGVHAALGSITVGQLINEWAFHDLGHIRQIAELFRSRAFYPAMGPFQSFYTIKP